MADTIIALRSGYSKEEAEQISKLVSEKMPVWYGPVRLMKAKETVYHCLSTTEYQRLVSEILDAALEGNKWMTKEEANYVGRRAYDELRIFASKHNIQEYVVSTVCSTGDYMLAMYLKDWEKEELLKILEENNIECTGVYSWEDDEINDSALEFVYPPVSM